MDHFKSVTDTHGHPAGDALLRAVARAVRDGVRPQDRVYRYGGEEFCVVLLDASPDVIAERICAAVADRALDIGRAEPLRATISIDTTTSAGSEPAALIARSDAALYEAKQTGRNRVRPG